MSDLTGADEPKLLNYRLTLAERAIAEIRGGLDKLESKIEQVDTRLTGALTKLETTLTIGKAALSWVDRFSIAVMSGATGAIVAYLLTRGGH